jgi:hypothetical protein
MSIDLSVHTETQKLENFINQYPRENDSDLILYYCIYSFDDLIETSNEDLEGYLSFLEPIKWTSDKNTEDTSEMFKQSNSNIAIQKKNNDYFLHFEFNRYVEEFCFNITEYIRNRVSKRHQNTYFTRLDMIKDTLIFLNEFTIKDIEVFTADIDDLLKNILTSLWLNYNHCLILDNLIYDRFSYDFETKFNEIQRLKNFKEAQKKIGSNKYLHLKEFMTIYRYVKIFPELISLGYIATQCSFKKVTFTFRLIVLFLSQNTHDLTKSRIFIMFLIKKAFSCTAKCNLDHIYTFNMQELNLSGISKLFFFIWEFNHYQRARQKSRIENFYYLGRNFPDEDLIHNNIVLRLYLFQHLIYLRYKNVKKNKFEKFKIYVGNVDDDRYVEQFYQFIKMF